MTTERMTGSELHRVDAVSAAPVEQLLAPSEQVRALARLAALLDLEQLVENLPDILSEIAPVDGVHYAGLTRRQQYRHGRRAKHSVEYRLIADDEQNLGTLTLYRGARFKEAELARLEALLPFLMLALRNALAHREAIENALTDPLTGVGNRAALEISARQQVDVAQRHGLPFSLLMIDIDHFKHINDTRGHAAGDDVLRTLAQIIAKAIRRSDVVFRYGGEEFVVLLAHTDDEGARVMAERVRILVAASKDLRKDACPGVTVSIGIGTLTTNDDVASLCHRADTALYRAKNEGRNRVVSAS